MIVASERLQRAWRWGMCVVLLGLIAGCQSSPYYASMERLGVSRGEVLAERVDAARQAQQRAREALDSALSRLELALSASPSTFSREREALTQALEKSDDAQRDLAWRLDDADEAAEAVFTEWHDELDDYHDERYRELSERQLAESRERYADIRQALATSREQMRPVTETLNDTALLLEHEEKARDLAALGDRMPEMRDTLGELATRAAQIDRETDALVEALLDVRE